MTDLDRRALATVALAREKVEDFYANAHDWGEAAINALCESHERLRMELQGAEALLAEDAAEIARLKARLALALALTDTGSAEFRAAFAPLNGSEAGWMSLPGWRVVEKVRSVLLGEA